MMTEWTICPYGQQIGRQRTMDMLGFIPSFLDDNSKERAAVQLGNNYAHGGGWRPLPGWTLGEDNSISYPGDPPYAPLAQTTVGDELVVVYAHAWVAIIQPDRSFEIARMD